MKSPAKPKEDDPLPGIRARENGRRILAALKRKKHLRKLQLVRTSDGRALMRVTVGRGPSREYFAPYSETAATIF